MMIVAGKKKSDSDVYNSKRRWHSNDEVGETQVVGLEGRYLSYE